MLADLQADHPNLPEATFDICIAGGGVAGITLAIKLASLGRRVALLEAGNLDLSDASQAFYRGENRGVENLPLHATRLRMLGGSSNHWGGWCRPFDSHDFDRADFSPDGTWPIAAGDLSPYLEDAASILAVNKYAGSDLDLKDAEGRLRTARMYFSAPPARVGLRYLEDIKQANNILLLLNAPVISAEFNDQSGLIRSVTIRQPNSNTQLVLRAKAFVLALGTVENVRALLMLNRAYNNKLGNQNQLVGKYYLQHLHQNLGQFLLLNEGPEIRPPADGENVRAFFLSTRDLLRKSGTGAFRLYSTAIDCSALRDDFRNIVTGAACASVRAGGESFITAEHMPNPDSRIVLADAKDEFGLPRVRLDWRISKLDHRTLREAGLEFGRYLIKAKLGRLKINPAILDGSMPLKGWTALSSAAGAAGHQMGGARMSQSSADGVVDKNCRVWGTNNLFVAGAAVFRTCSQTTPTLTIVQLCLRLADHLHHALGQA